jgi:hypothetical protein
MHSAKPSLSRQTPGGLVSAYVGELRRWASRIGTGYAVAAVVLLIGCVSLVVSLGVATSALFTVLAARYGLTPAYGMIGGGFLLIGLVALATGLSLLKRSPPPMPSPKRQLRALPRVAVPSLVRLSTGGIEAGARANPKVLAGLATLVLVGIAASVMTGRRSGADDGGDAPR